MKLCLVTARVSGGADSRLCKRERHNEIDWSIRRFGIARGFSPKIRTTAI